MIIMMMMMVFNLILVTLFGYTYWVGFMYFKSLMKGREAAVGVWPDIINGEGKHNPTQWSVEAPRVMKGTVVIY